MRIPLCLFWATYHDGQPEDERRFWRVWEPCGVCESLNESYLPWWRYQCALCRRFCCTSCIDGLFSVGFGKEAGGKFEHICLLCQGEMKLLDGKVQFRGQEMVDVYELDRRES